MMRRGKGLKVALLLCLVAILLLVSRFGWRTHQVAEVAVLAITIATPAPQRLPDPIPQLQGVVDEVAAGGGGVVNVPPGNHLLTGTLNLWANTTLKGSGSQSCLTMQQGGVDLINVAGSNVTIEDLCLVGGSGIASLGGNGPGKAVTNEDNTKPLQNVTIRDLEISNVPSMAIYLSGSPHAYLRDIVVEDNIIRSTGGHGIAVGFAGNGRVAGNSLKDTAQGGMTYGDGAIDIEGVSHFVIDGNRVENSIASGIQVNNADWTTISNNVVVNTRLGSGLAFWNSSHDTITGNVSRRNQEDGFYWALNQALGSTAGSNEIRGNVAEANGTNGFQFYQQTDVQFVGNSAIDNNASDSGASGLVIQQWCRRFWVAGNVFRNSVRGVGQIYGISTPDPTTKALQVSGDNTFFQMVEGDAR